MIYISVLLCIAAVYWVYIAIKNLNELLYLHHSELNLSVQEARQNVANSIILLLLSNLLLWLSLMDKLT